jgi:hypothetical protein
MFVMLAALLGQTAVTIISSHIKFLRNVVVYLHYLTVGLAGGHHGSDGTKFNLVLLLLLQILVHVPEVHPLLLNSCHLLTSSEIPTLEQHWK